MASQPPTSDAVWRAEWEARYMPDSRLATLIAQGPQGLDPVLWKILVDERARRDRPAPFSGLALTDSARYESASSEIVLGETNPRYPALASIVVLLKVIAVTTCIAGLVLSTILYKSRQPAAAAAWASVSTLWTLLTWAAAESIAVLTDIEANTRAAAEALRSQRR